MNSIGWDSQIDLKFINNQCDRDACMHACMDEMDKMREDQMSWWSSQILVDEIELVEWVE